METPANMTEIQKTIEAVLFAAGHPVTYQKLGDLLEIPPEQIKLIIQDYSDIYNSEELPRGVMLIAYDESCQLCTKEEYAPYIREALGIRRGGNLSVSSIETLAIIAYNQPVTRAYVDTVRGVDSSYAINSLLERSLIDVCGRLDAPGRPMLYGTTADFLRCFGLSSLAQLPAVDGYEPDMLASLEISEGTSGD